MFFVGWLTSGQAPVGANPLREKMARDTEKDTIFWLTASPDTYRMESGYKDTVVLSPTSVELGLGTD